MKADCLATHTYSPVQIKSLRAVSFSYDVPYTTLYDRIHGALPRRDTRPTTCKLTAIEEVLLECMFNLDPQGSPPRASIVRETANIILSI